MAFEFLRRKRVETAADSRPDSSAEPAFESVALPKRSIQSAIRSLFGGGSLDISQLEDVLLRADFGVEAAEEITREVEHRAKAASITDDSALRALLASLISERLQRSDAQLNLAGEKLPYVFLVVGVNGVGKTTTIGKLAGWLTEGGWSVVLGAADTFRAAAAEQLQTWGARCGAEVVMPEQVGQDPAAVAYRTVARAIELSADIAIIDTAGRLQNKKDLMDELGKIRRSVEKQAAVSEVLLVIDATTGQNALAQAKAFSEVAAVTGLVATKLDGSAKGGVLYSIQQQLDIPIKLVGVGEGVQDFAFFDATEFARGLVARPAI